MADDNDWTAVEVRADEAVVLVIGTAAHLIVTEGAALLPWDQRWPSLAASSNWHGREAT